MMTDFKEIAVTIIVTLAALLHGLVGFGFPLYSTALISLFSDVKYAIVITVIPNLLINAICIFSGGKLSPELKKYWSIALYVLIGTLFGSQALLFLNPNFLKFLLALMIVLYLTTDKLKKIHFLNTIGNHYLMGPLAGLSAGFLSGSVNVASVPLVLYFLSKKLPINVMFQVLNLCFAAGKLVQVFSLTYQGALEKITLPVQVIIIAGSLLGLLIGFLLNKQVTVKSYNRIISLVLAVIAVVLFFQVAYTLGHI